MTTLKEAAQQALGALKSVQDHRPNDETNNAITALRAAPDLLEALREAVIEVTSVAGAVTPTTDMVINAQDCLTRAMAAIAKAEGRTE